MPLGTEYSFGAGDIRAAAAVVDLAELPDDESVEFSFEDRYYTFLHPYTSDIYWLVEDAELIDAPSDVEAIAEAGGWSIFAQYPWERDA